MRQGTATHRHELTPYTGAEYPHSVWWALPAKHLPDDVCYGTTDRQEIAELGRPDLYYGPDACRFPETRRTANRTLLSFDSISRTNYATDLLFDADAKVPREDVSISFEGKTLTIRIDAEPSLEQTMAALAVIAPIIDLLLNVYEIDPAAMTLVATRRGVQLHVDWTVIGPIRIHEAGLLVAELARQAGVPTDLDGGEHAARLDTGFYVAKDVNRSWMHDEDDFSIPVGSLNGPPIRAVGALHHKSSATMVYRATPVPLKWRTRPDLLFKASRMSRREFDAGASWPFAELTQWLLPRCRASRNPALWKTPVRPCVKLIGLYEDIASGKLTPPGASRLRRKGEGVRARPQGGPALAEIDADRITELVERAGRRVTNHAGGKVHPDSCLVCGKPGKATFWTGTGTYTCFSCDGNAPKSFAFMCDLFAAADLIPKGASALPSISIVDPATVKRALEVVPDHIHPATSLDDAGRIYQQVIRETAQPVDWQFLLLEETFNDLPITQVANDPADAIHVLVGPCGTGKSVKGQEELVRLGVYRAFVPRRDAQRDWGQRDSNAVVLQGLRAIGDDLNCMNPEAELVRALGDSPARLLCNGCQYRKQCGYRAQEFGTDKPLILNHAHLPFADMVKFNNGSKIDFIDEGALGALIDVVKIERSNLHSYRIQNVFDTKPGIITFGFNDEPWTFVERTAVDPNIDALLTLLEGRLSKMAADAGSARQSATLLANTSQADEVSDDRPLEKEGHARGHVLVEYLLTGDWNASKESVSAALAAPTGYAAALDALATDPLWRKAHEGLRLGHHAERGVPDEPPMPIQTAADREAEARELTEARRTGAKVPDIAVWRPDAYLVPLIDALVADLTDYRASPVHRLNTRVIMRHGERQQYRLELTRMMKPAIPAGKPVVVANATATKDSVQMLFPDRPVVMHKVTVPRAGKLVVVNDHLFSKSQLHEKRWFDVIVHMLEAVLAARKPSDRLIGIIAHSEIYNRLNRALMPKEKNLPSGPGMAADSAARLRKLTMKRGYIAGYHRGVAGSNAFCGDDGRFVGQLFVLGPPILPVDEWAVGRSPLFAGNNGTIHGVAEPIDASTTRISVPFPDYRTSDGKAVVANNLPFPSDARLTEMAWEEQAGALEQSNGRARLYLPQNADSVVYQLGAFPTGEPPDEMITFGELLRRLSVTLPVALEAGIESKNGKSGTAGRPPGSTGYETYAELRRQGTSHADAVSQVGAPERTGFRWKAQFEKGAGPPSGSHCH